MAQVNSVFVDGLPPHWDEDRVRETFKCFGEIARIMLTHNMSTAKRKDFGFVDFTTHEAAVSCVEDVNNMELGDGNSKVFCFQEEVLVEVVVSSTNPTFSMDQDPDYVKRSNCRPRYEDPEASASFHGSHYRDASGADGGPYQQDYYGSDHGAGASFYQGDRPYGRGYYY